ncbi:NCS1 family nucleobase:cation symporter-1 [Saccharopolyspora sp. WRP15-2]|uniref:NCS1 family nucleobase:cation symporter-1 n=1 Tax=Saccharopolyspora oryzae TaxID=2997343 RepID=A0ABT4UZB3_9PSEU|nr:NCS1 family nucleobase:cation symporter-1 [Saccharopolyspora oryzae]MDA3627060.1 NCS1 family nucleobase:cation symporter-1 [Saccharopolyspora oryzae]
MPEPAHPHLAALDPEGRLYNEDLAPATERRWNSYNYFAVWMSAIHNIGTYTFVAGMFALGLTAWQVLISITIGIAVLYSGLLLAGRMGVETGIPFPVMARISFGVWGANLPALIRAVIAIAWYGIQTYLASLAVVVLLLRIDPGLSAWQDRSFLGLSLLGWACFLLLWVLQLFVVTRGMEAVRRFQDWAGPLIWVVMLGMAVWLFAQAGWNLPMNLSVQPVEGNTTLVVLGGAFLLVATYATMTLNYCDFTRFGKSRGSVRWGTFWGIPVNFIAFSAVSIATTVGAVTVFGTTITDPALIIARVPNTAVLVIGAVMFIIATIGVNVVLNFVSPAYDLANIWPKHITFKRGGLISAVLALLVMPWKLYSSPIVVNYFLGGLGALLGPLFGIMAVDYFLIRRGRVLIDSLYKVDESGEYHYVRGVNRTAIAVLVPTAVIAAVIALVPAFSAVAAFSWPIGVVLSGLAYFAAMRRSPAAEGSGDSHDVSSVQAVDGSTAEPDRRH